MNYVYSLLPEINLHVAGRISQQDANRQQATAQFILEKLLDQPGLVLADEVGMGKTYIALAVAISVAIQDKEKRPIVVMVPPSLTEKWLRDFNLFRERCLPSNYSKLRCDIATRSVEFFRLLDDPEERRCHIILLTHGAMTRQLSDPWVKLAIIQRSLHRRHHTEVIRQRLYRDLPGLLQLKGKEANYPGLIATLLDKAPHKWFRIIARHGMEMDDDPVPQHVIDALPELDLSNVYESLYELPQRVSKNYDDYINESKRLLSQQTKRLWMVLLKKTNLKLPLLIMDEAHHLKNPHTKLSSLFASDDAKEDAESIQNNHLAGVFERMIFLTATPFQLGHHELCSVLNRFSGISWDTASAPRAGREAFQYSLATLQAKLDAAQESAIRLDRAWGRLSPEDLYLDDRIYTDVAEWWQAYKPHSQVSEAAKSVRMAYDQVAVHMREAESCLKGWIVRHLRDRYMPSPCSNTPRRQKYEGASIINEEQNQQGILIEQQSLLPFLLAARLAAKKPEQRPVFAEGLASSYDAFLRATTANDRDEYKNVLTDTDDDDDTAREVDADDWHMVQLKRSILQKGQFNESNHPKVKATVDKVFELWLAGEKVLVFNHYIATGHVLRAQISNRFAQYTLEQAASQFGVSLEEAEKELGRIGDRFYDKDSPWRKSCDEQVKNILAAYEVLNSNAGLILDVTRRYIRTPSFLVRFFSLADMSDAKVAVDNAFRQQDASGMSLYDLVNQFCEFLALRCGESERESFLAAIHNIQTGSNFGEAALTSFSDQEIEEAGNSTLLANVRLVNGATKTDSRQRLMLAFNTPFYPDVLISSSVLSEGVDLHLNCRHVIHHDLSWNPSTLEQRNGRVDRIGSKSERCAQPIKVYYPFIAATQDEKMYRVVMDRERWFNVVMGDNYKVDTKTTDALAERLPFPEVAASEIGFNLTAHK